MPVLDGWRGVAVLGVLFGHFVTIQGINLGRFGVELFFVLSGRLMAEILFVRSAELPRFYLRRFARVYPALFVFVVVTTLASQLLPGFAVDWMAALSSLTFVYNYVGASGLRSPFMDHLWSLCIEEHIYIVLGIIAFGSRRFGAPAPTIILALAIAFILNGFVQSYALGLDYYAVYWRTDVRGASILLGAAAFLLMRQCAFPPRVSGMLAVVCGLLAIGLNVNLVPDPIKYSVGSALLAVTAYSITDAPAFVRTVLASRFLVVTGVASYSLYLWQQPFAQVGQSFMQHMMLLPLALIAAAVSFLLVESPLRRQLNKQIDLCLTNVRATPRSVT
ncbi:acyltransferase family protein [Devosia sp. CN2-171]|uniref:acyltransferase family protein n=1 Tax=Devosia sp. CN2-171 TaxID=3400909 RepID=UPI003BF823D5